MQSRILILVACIALVMGGCGGGSALVSKVFEPVGPTSSADEGAGRAQLGGDALNLSAELIRNTAGVPTGVRLTWDRVADERAIGYYLYRRDQPFPDGDPSGFESFRANNGQMIDQPASGDTVSFDDEFYPDVGTTWYYRVTVVNNTNDESDFSNEISITIVQFSFDSFDPTSGTVNDPVSIFGSNFGIHRESEDHVYFSGPDGAWVEATITSWTQTQIDVDVPVGAITGPIRVQIGDLYIDSTDNFTVFGPVLDSVSPTEDYAEHLDITLTGSNFEDVQGSSVVTFNGVEVNTYVSWTDTQIVVKVPADATSGPVKVRVGANESGGIDFTVLPHIDSVTPDSASVDEQVTLSGTGFGDTQGSSFVTFNGIVASITSWSNREIRL